MNLLKKKSSEDVNAAWLEFLDWATGEPEILMRYERASGNKILGCKLVVADYIVAEERRRLRDLVVWLTKVYWGEKDAPSKYYDMIQRVE